MIPNFPYRSIIGMDIISQVLTSCSSLLLSQSMCVWRFPEVWRLLQFSSGIEDGKFPGSWKNWAKFIFGGVVGQCIFCQFNPIYIHCFSCCLHQVVFTFFDPIIPRALVLYGLCSASLSAAGVALNSVNSLKLAEINT